MSHPYDPQNPQSQPSANPYEQPGGQQYPPAGQEYPPAGQQYPAAGQQYPDAGQQYPAAGQQYPDAGQQYPANQPTPYGQPVPYGQQPYGAGGGEHPQGTIVFVLGIVGIFVAVCAPIAWYLGNKALREITASGASYSNESQIKTGRMLGKVFTIIYIVLIVLYIIALIVIFGMAASQGTN